jgi:hypothetical protein
MHFLAKQLLWANLIMIGLALMMYSIILRATPSSLVYPNENHRNIDWTELPYFTIITHSTVGYGDIIPTTTLMRSAITLHLLCLIVVNALVVMSTAGHVEQTQHGVERARVMLSRISRIPE